jgi:hypothetical protein
VPACNALALGDCFSSCWPIAKNSLGKTNANEARKRVSTFKKRPGVAEANVLPTTDEVFSGNGRVLLLENAGAHCRCPCRVGFTESRGKPAVHEESFRGLRGEEGREDMIQSPGQILVKLPVWLVIIPPRPPPPVG